MSIIFIIPTPRQLCIFSWLNHTTWPWLSRCFPKERNSLLGKRLLGWKAVFPVATSPDYFAAPAWLPVWKQLPCLELEHLGKDRTSFICGNLMKNSRSVKCQASHVFACSCISQSLKFLILGTHKTSHWNLWLKSFPEPGILPSSLHPKLSYKRDKDHEPREGWEIIGPRDTLHSLPGCEASVALTLCTSVKVGNPNLALLCVVNETLEDNSKQLKKLH